MTAESSTQQVTEKKPSLLQYIAQQLKAPAQGKVAELVQKLNSFVPNGNFADFLLEVEAARKPDSDDVHLKKDFEGGSHLFTNTAEFVEYFTKHLTGIENELFAKNIFKPAVEEWAKTQPKEEGEGVGVALPDVFMDENGVPYAEIAVNSHTELWAVRSRVFANYFVKTIFEQEGKAPSESQVKQWQALNSARALASGETKRTHLRFACEDGAIYYDPCRSDWAVLKITSETIEWLPKSPVAFRRYGHMREVRVDLNALISDIDRFFNYLPAMDEQDKILYKTSLVLNCVPHIPRCIDLYYGCQGSAKSTTMKLNRILTDNSSLLLLSLPRDSRELVQQAYHHYQPYYDNISDVPKYISDFFCRACTGEGQSNRELYSDDEDIVRQLMRKLALNGINLPLTEPDALDRSITYRFARIDKTQRRTEQEIFSDFFIEQPKITGALLKLLQLTLKIIPNVKLREKPRMADYAVWCEAASRAMGNIDNIFLHAFWQKIGALNKDALESQPIGVSVLEFMRTRSEWEGSASELLVELENIAQSLKINTKSKEWTTSSSWLSRKLNELKTNLFDEGIKFETTRVGAKKTIRFSKNAENAVMPSQTENSRHETSSDGIVTARNMPSQKTLIDDGNDGIKNMPSQLPSPIADSGFPSNDGNDGISSKSLMREMKKIKPAIFSAVGLLNNGDSGAPIDSVINEVCAETKASTEGVQAGIDGLLSSGELVTNVSGFLRVGRTAIREAQP